MTVLIVEVGRERPNVRIRDCDVAVRFEQVVR